MPNSYLVSFDVRNFFTNVPIDDTINHLCNLIDFNAFPINEKTLRTLLSLACKNILFQFNGKLYTQNDGVAMGSKLAPTLASFAMDLIESKLETQPLYYRRYVDDVFAIFNNHKEAEDYLKYLNSFHDNLQFTMETEKDEKLRFLDVIVHKGDKFETEWCLKDTNTGIYIPNDSFAPFKYKTEAIRALINRAKLLSSTENFFNKGYEKIVSIFVSNGFHINVVEKIKEKVLSSLSQKERNPEVKRIFWRLPYIKEKEKETIKVVHSVNKILPTDCKLSVIFDTYKTRNIFPNKDKVSANLASNLVYKYQCWQCDNCYIGETRRHLYTRIQEHLDGRPKDSEITKHSEIHKSNDKNFSIICKTKYTRIAESLIMKYMDKNLLLNECDSSVPLHVY